MTEQFVRGRLYWDHGPFSVDWHPESQHYKIRKNGKMLRVVHSWNDAVNYLDWPPPTSPHGESIKTKATS